MVNHETFYIQIYLFLLSAEIYFKKPKVINETIELVSDLPRGNFLSQIKHFLY